MLPDIYNEQSGSVNWSSQFDNSRGAKQGDVLSLLLFHSGLAHALREFKRRFPDPGLDINGEILSNMRYADDILFVWKIFRGAYGHARCSGSVIVAMRSESQH